MKYKIGDKVRVKQWEDMAKEGGIFQGDINLGGICFVDDMKSLCGTEVTISKVLNERYGVEECNWVFSDEMFEPVEKYPMMSSNDVWKWLGRNHLNSDIYEEVFGVDFALCDLVAQFSFEEVVELVSKYESEKEQFIPFDINNLESRMVVECNNGTRYMVIVHSEHIVGMKDGDYILINSSHFDEHAQKYGYEINKVFPQVNSFDQLNWVQEAIWERK